MNDLSVPPKMRYFFPLENQPLLYRMMMLICLVFPAFFHKFYFLGRVGVRKWTLTPFKRRLSHFLPCAAGLFVDGRYAGVQNWNTRTDDG